MSEIKVIGWDHDYVAVQTTGTNISIKGITEKRYIDPAPFIRYFIDDGWATEDEFHRWEQEYNDGKKIDNLNELAVCLTDFLYKMKRGDSHIFTKDQIVASKQVLLKGTTIKEIRNIIERFDDYTPGFKEAVGQLKDCEQTLYSDSMAPVIEKQIEKLGLDAGRGVPVGIEKDGTNDIYFGVYGDFNISLLDWKLNGKKEDFFKTVEFMKYLNNRGIGLDEVAIIDDSGNNLEDLHKPVHEAGGIAIAFNPRSDKHYKSFQESGIPILKQDEPNLEPFIEIVKNPKSIGKYCI